MNLAEAITSALTQLRAHRLRSALSMLGIVFGVGAVIAMLSIGAGGERQALAMIDRLGVRNVLVRAKKIEPDRRAELRRRSLGVSDRDGEALAEAVAGVELVVPRIELASPKVLAAGAKTEAKVQGTSHRMAELVGLELAEGRYFDALDERDHAQVAVIGADVRRDLFGYGPVLGKHLKIGDVWFEVIGVFASPEALGKSLEGVTIASTAQEIHVPFTTIRRKLDRDPLEAPVDELVVRMAVGVAPSAAAATARPLLERLHGGADDFELVVPEALLEQSRKTRRLFNLVMGSIAGISLLVGGIGIMNIMLASVLERVREIGIRRALGARRRDIRRQFVIEAFTISVLGGSVGILLGVVLARAISAWAGWPTVVTLWSLALSAGVATSVGLVSGIYPATRAAELDPIEALRYE